MMIMDLIVVMVEMGDGGESGDGGDGGEESCEYYLSAGQLWHRGLELSGKI